MHRHCCLVSPGTAAALQVVLCAAPSSAFMCPPTCLLLELHQLSCQLGQVLHTQATNVEQSSFSRCLRLRQLGVTTHLLLASAMRLTLRCLQHHKWTGTNCT